MKIIIENDKCLQFEDVDIFLSEILYVFSWMFHRQVTVDSYSYFSYKIWYTLAHICNKSVWRVQQKY